MFQEEEIIKMMTCAVLRGGSSDLVQLLFYDDVLGQALLYYKKTKLDAVYEQKTLVSLSCRKCFILSDVTEETKVFVKAEGGCC